MARLQGARTRVYKRAPRARDRIWFAVRALRRFDLPMIIATAEAGADNARRYLRGLADAGFVRRVQTKQNGVKGSGDVWMLIRDPGPLAPRLQSNGATYDPNHHLVYQGGLVQRYVATKEARHG